MERLEEGSDGARGRLKRTDGQLVLHKEFHTLRNTLAILLVVQHSLYCTKSFKRLTGS